MGRKADRPEVKAAKGNPGRRPIRKAAPGGAEPSVIVEGGLPDWVNTAKAVQRRRPTTQKGRAEFMTGLTEQIWNFIRPELLRMNLAKRIDDPMLAIFCRAFAEYIAAIIELDRDGMTYKTESAHSGVIHRLHPATRVRKDALQTIKEQGDTLGITPLARQRLFQMMADAARGQLPLEEAGPLREQDLDKVQSPVGLLLN